jgi:hypothetical protein
MPPLTPAERVRRHRERKREQLGPVSVGSYVETPAGNGYVVDLRGSRCTVRIRQNDSTLSRECEVQMLKLLRTPDTIPEWLWGRHHRGRKQGSKYVSLEGMLPDDRDKAEGRMQAENIVPPKQYTRRALGKGISGRKRKLKDWTETVDSTLALECIDGEKAAKNAACKSFDLVNSKGAKNVILENCHYAEEPDTE